MSKQVTSGAAAPVTCLGQIGNTILRPVVNYITHNVRQAHTSYHSWVDFWKGQITQLPRKQDIQSNNLTVTSLQHSKVVSLITTIPTDQCWGRAMSRRWELKLYVQERHLTCNQTRGAVMLKEQPVRLRRLQMPNPHVALPLQENVISGMIALLTSLNT